MPSLKLSNIASVTLPILALLALNPQVSRADTPMVLTMHLTGVTNSVLGGVYISPYEFQFGADPTPSSPTYWLVCDDFLTDISIGKAWTADAYALNASDIGYTKFNPASVTVPDSPNQATWSVLNSYTRLQVYEAAALLAQELLVNPTPNNDNPGLLSYAIWQIFDPKAVLGYNGQALDGPQDLVVSKYMKDALNAAAGSSYNLQAFVYTPDPLSDSQEFIGLALPSSNNSIPVPETASIFYTVFDILAVCGMILLVRRKSAFVQ